MVRQRDGATALIYNERGGVQSVSRPGNALNRSDYYDDYLLIPFLTATPRRVAVLGSAGGTIPHLLSVYDKMYFPAMNVTGVKIDPSVIPLGYRYFGLKPTDATVVNEDARMFIRQPGKQFDIVIVDAYINEIYIPPHMITKEFFQEIRYRLTPDGVVALNLNVTNPKSPMLKAFEKTLTTVYPDVYRVKARGDFNYLLIGAQHPLTTRAFRRISAASPLESIADEWPSSLQPLTNAVVDGSMLLTDNHASVEMLTDSMVFAYDRN
ncbi:spermidine synthase [Ferroacidibacillus organovorans]|nr:fused MFS/spermidine synthase [Ferroacidibacillus organovorans]